MFLALSIILFVLLIGLWLAVMYTWWRKEQGITEPKLHPKHFTSPLESAMRLIRRSWYRTSHLGAKVGSWGGSKAEAALVKVFPSAAQAFTKRDTMTGLTEGPSSYFLKSISEEVPKPKKTRRTTKIV